MPRTGRSLAVFCLLMCVAILPSHAIAQGRTAVASTSFHGTSAGHNEFATEEVTLSGTIERVIPAGATGKPQVLHLLLSGPHGALDANLGPYLTKEVQESLSPGQHVEVTGVERTLNSRNSFLVRQLTVGGRQVTIRNEQGFLIRPRKQSVTRTEQALRKGENQ